MQGPGEIRFRLVSGVSKEKGTSRVPVSRSCDKCVLDPEPFRISHSYYLFPVPETGWNLLQCLYKFISNIVFTTNKSATVNMETAMHW